MIRGLDREAAAALIADARRMAPWRRRCATARRAVRAATRWRWSSCRVRCPRAQLAGDEPLPRSLPLTPNVERLFLERVRRLPEPAQQVLSFVAAEDSGRLAPVMRAAEAAGIERRRAGGRRAGRAGVGARRARRGAPSRSCARRSCRACRPGSAAPRISRWPARSTTTAASTSARGTWRPLRSGPDADVAGELERGRGARAAPERARLGGGRAGAGGRAERRRRRRKGRRLAAAAAAAWHAGQPERASVLLDRADPLVSDRRLRADVVHLRGEIQLRCGVLARGVRHPHGRRRGRRAARHAQGAGDAARRRARRPAGRATRRGRSRPAIAPRRCRGARIRRAAFLADLLVGVGKPLRGRDGDRRCHSSATSSPAPTSSTSRAGSSGRRPVRRGSATRRGRRSCCGARSRWRARRAPSTSSPTRCSRTC